MISLVFLIETISHGWISFIDLPKLALTSKSVNSLFNDMSFWTTIASKINLPNPTISTLKQDCRDFLSWHIQIFETDWNRKKEGGRVVELKTQDPLIYEAALLTGHVLLARIEITYRGEEVKQQNDNSFYMTPRVAWSWVNRKNVKLQATGLVGNGKSCLTIKNKGNASGLFVGDLREQDKVINLISSWPHRSFTCTSFVWALHKENDKGILRLFTRKSYGSGWLCLQMFKDGQFSSTPDLVFSYVK